MDLMAGTRNSGRKIDEATRAAMHADYLAGTWPGRTGKRFCSLDEIAARYSVSPRTVYKLAADGRWAEQRRMQENAENLPALVSAQQNQIVQVGARQKERMAFLQEQALGLAIDAMGRFGSRMGEVEQADPLALAGVGVKMAEVAAKFAPYHPELSQQHESGVTDEERIRRLAALFDRARARRDGGAAE